MSKKLPLTPAMAETIRDAFLDEQGRVLVICTDDRTRGGLIRRGATELPRDGVYLQLHGRLIVHAVKLADAAYREQLMDPFAHETQVLTRREPVSDGFSTRRMALCWAAVRAGHRTPERGIVASWGTSHEGWVFRPRYRYYDSRIH